MREIDWMEVFKWVFIVLLAGFIGQFGKRLADHLVKRGTRLKKGSQKEGGEAPAAEGGTIEPAEQLSSPSKAVEGISPEEDVKARAKREKKEAKARLKLMKKEGGKTD
ncbi:MAG: hypothetical protein JXO48_12275 [Deltaproteobacteria bacterium]|nr:hypothetical protein [Deltaproteobacteria bacterium]